MSEILVVDDDSDSRELVGFLLRARGYSTRMAGDGRQALAAMRERPPDAVVLDLMMPNVDGREVIQRMKEHDRLRSIPVVVLSGAADVGDRVDGCAVLRKPLQPESLLAAIDRCLEGDGGRP